MAVGHLTSTVDIAGVQTLENEASLCCFSWVCHSPSISLPSSPLSLSLFLSLCCLSLSLHLDLLLFLALSLSGFLFLTLYLSLSLSLFLGLSLHLSHSVTPSLPPHSLCISLCLDISSRHSTLFIRSLPCPTPLPLPLWTAIHLQPLYHEQEGWSVSSWPLSLSPSP